MVLQLANIEEKWERTIIDRSIKRANSSQFSNKHTYFNLLNECNLQRSIIMIMRKCNEKGSKIRNANTNGKHPFELFIVYVLKINPWKVEWVNVLEKSICCRHRPAIIVQWIKCQSVWIEYILQWRCQYDNLMDGELQLYGLNTNSMSLCTTQNMLGTGSDQSNIACTELAHTLPRVFFSSLYFCCWYDCGEWNCWRYDSKIEKVRGNEGVVGRAKCALFRLSDFAEIRLKAISSRICLQGVVL